MWKSPVATSLTDRLQAPPAAQSAGATSMKNASAHAEWPHSPGVAGAATLCGAAPNAPRLSALPASRLLPQVAAANSTSPAAAAERHAFITSPDSTLAGSPHVELEPRAHELRLRRVLWSL